METLPKLTPTQALLLRAAARRADGRVIPPANLRGGARVKAVSELLRLEWIEAGDGGYVLTDAGYALECPKNSWGPRSAQAQVLALFRPVQRERCHQVLHRQVGRVPAVQDCLDDGR
jgi:hypothetical protein